MLKNAYRAFLDGNLKEACEKRLRYLLLEVQATSKRDESLTKQLMNLQAKNKGKEVLVLVGGAHAIHQRLQEKGLEVKQEFPYKPYIFGVSTEVLRKIYLKNPYTQEEIAKTLLNDFVGGYLDAIGLPYSLKVKKTRNIVEKLGYNDIKSLSIYLSGNYRYKNMATEAVVLWLKRKGFKI